MTRKKLLTKSEVVEAINQWIVEHGLPPTVEELRQVLKVGSKRTVLRYLNWLQDEGDIDRWPGARGLRLKRHLGIGAQTRRVPLVGEATAGALMLAEENREGWVQLPAQYLTPASAKHFLLRVKGDSMNKAKVEGGKIENGDLVVVEQRSSANLGEIIVALVDGEATIKRLVKGDGYYILKPESTKSYSPIILAEDFQVQGVVKRVLKKGAFLLDDND
ncbi:MAG TPA: transcriptional repressor LexA [Pirellulaceae bacterium]|nr:transcriptional repressor LexA [Pyrinomonadaceae bacterium]HMP65570.1 transcriptional repressor LexA [Pyrinomonadaceae bacterium]HMP70724.1 transcriptional repressor LexA [Pirellulaceae bacterium]